MRLVGEVEIRRLSRAQLEAVPLAEATVAALVALKRAHDDDAVTEAAYEALAQRWQPYLHSIGQLERWRFTWELFRHCFGAPSGEIRDLWHAWIGMLNDAVLEEMMR